jgi:MFS family permease
MSSTPSTDEKTGDPEAANVRDVTQASPPPPEDASPRQVHGIAVRLLPIPLSTPHTRLTSLQWALVVAGTLSSIFLYSLDNTVVADVTPAAVNAFGDVLKLPWLSVGFLLGGIGVVLPLGRVFGLFDAKWLYVASCVVFNVGSAVCAAAPSMDALIVGRVLAGAGGNGMYLGVMTLLSGNTSDRERPGYLSFV